MDMDDSTKLFISMMREEFALLRTQVSAIDARLDKLSSDNCLDCYPAKEIESHLEEHKAKKEHKWQLALVVIGAAAGYAAIIIEAMKQIVKPGMVK